MYHRWILIWISFFLLFWKWPSSGKKWLRGSSFPPTQNGRWGQRHRWTAIIIVNINIKLNISWLNTFIGSWSGTLNRPTWSWISTGNLNLQVTWSMASNIYGAKFECSIILLGKQVSNKKWSLEQDLEERNLFIKLNTDYPQTVK